MSKSKGGWSKPVIHSKPHPGAPPPPPPDPKQGDKKGGK